MSLSYLWALAFKAPLIILSTIVFGSLSVLVSLGDRSGRLTDGIARAWAGWLLLLSGVKVLVRGREHLDPSSCYVLAGNHLSLIDTPVVLAHVPVRFLFLVNAKYVRMPFLGTHLRRCGHFSIDQDDVRASLKVMTQAARTARERGLSILLFPEGSRARGERMGEFKEGAVYIAIKAGVPLIPFAIDGTQRVLPVGSAHVRGGTVDLVFGEPISTAGCTLQNRSELNRVLHERVARLSKQLREGGAP